MAQDPNKEKKNNAQAPANEPKANELSPETKEHLKKLRTTSHAVRRYDHEFVAIVCI